MFERDEEAIFEDFELMSCMNDISEIADEDKRSIESSMGAIS